MNSDTYEFQNTRKTLETYEWDRLWIDHPYGTDQKRVLYIGDSISHAIRSLAPGLAGNEYFWDSFATSKSLDNPYFSPSLHLVHEQAPRCDVLLFNNGLHGWHLEDEEEYANAFEQMIRFLTEEWKDTPVVVVLTTCLADQARNERVLIRNKAAQAVAERYSLPVLDLYSVSLAHQDKQSADGVHFTPEGNEFLTQAIFDFLKNGIF